MLGERLGEGTGKITGVRVVSSDEMEISIQGSGTILGVATNVFGTYTQTLRPDGQIHGGGELISLTEDGEKAAFKGLGVGQPTGPGFSASFSFAGTMDTESEKLASLNTVVTIGEWEVTEEGEIAYELWEWKSKAAGS